MTDEISQEMNDNPVEKIDKLIHEPSRMLIMSNLYVVESADFTYLVRMTGLTFGNLSGHMSKLEKAGYLTVNKEFREKKPQTTLSLTEEGRQAFKKYMSNMKGVFDGID